MAIEVMGNDVSLKVLIAQHNAAVDEIARLKDTVHYDVSARRGGAADNPRAVPYEVTAPDATNLATAITLALNIKQQAGYHWRNAFAHVDGSVLTFTAPDPTNEGTLVTWCIELKAKYNGHLEDTDQHQKTDVTNAIAASTPTNTAECVTLLNEAKADLNAHILDAPLAAKINSIPV